MRQSYFSNLLGILIGVNLIQLLVSIATVTVTTSLFWQLTSLSLMFAYIYLWVLLINKALQEQRLLFLLGSIAYWFILASIIFLTRSELIPVALGTIQIFLIGLPFSPLYFPEGYTALYLLCGVMVLWNTTSAVTVIKQQLVTKNQ
ncbi:MAG: hypothetical protein ACRC6H_02665 [Culicoidibacterales bacterium]